MVGARLGRVNGTKVQLSSAGVPAGILRPQLYATGEDRGRRSKYVVEHCLWLDIARQMPADTLALLKSRLIYEPNCARAAYSCCGILARWATRILSNGFDDFAFRFTCGQEENVARAI